MNSVRLLLICSALLLSACITTTTGDVGSAPDKNEAARLNMDLGISYLRQGEYQQAVLKLKRSLQEEPNNSTAHRALGLAYERLGDDVGAEKEYRIAVKQGPNDADALNQLAVFSCQHGNRKEGLKLYDRAIAVPLYQNKAMLYTNAGSCAKETDLVLAESYLRRALAQQDNYPQALLQLADVSYQQGYFLQARAFLERYVAVGQVGADVLLLGYRIETALNNQVAAGQLADRLLKEFPISIEAKQLQDERRDIG